VRQVAAVMLCTLALLITPVRGQPRVTSTETDWPVSVTTVSSPAAPQQRATAVVHAGRSCRTQLGRTDGRERHFALRGSQPTAGGPSHAPFASGANWFVNWADVPSVIPLQHESMAAPLAPEERQQQLRVRRAPRVFQRPRPDVVEVGHAAPRRDANGAWVRVRLFRCPARVSASWWLDGRQMKAGAHEAWAPEAWVSEVRCSRPMAIRHQKCQSTIESANAARRHCLFTVDGPIVAYRNRTSDEIRDIYVSRLVGGRWTQGRAVHNDNWRIAACPVNGPALSAKGRDVAIAWFTAVGDAGRVYAAFSSDAGDTSARRFASTTSVPWDGSMSNCSLTARRRFT